MYIRRFVSIIYKLAPIYDNSFLSMEIFYTTHEGLIQVIGISIGIILAYISILQPIMSYSNAQKKLNKDNRFQNYHILIDHFAGANGNAKLDRQIAIVYELRRYPEYFPVTKRIFTDWNTTILADQNHLVNQRLKAEIDITLEYIDSNWFNRKFNFRNK
jgi:hypothetical protein